jgi:hypothetical protein
MVAGVGWGEGRDGKGRRERSGKESASKRDATFFSSRG